MDNPLSVNQEFDKMFGAGKCLRTQAARLLEEINGKEIKLFDLPAHKRIFLFIITRAIKTFSAIEILCQAGYGQDVAALVRSLMEVYITARYIVADPIQADDLARRFVDYKWILFRRSLAEEEILLRDASPKERQEFEDRKTLVIKHVEEFKAKYHIISDKSLLTWSGKTLKDMARQVSKELMREYESTFRLCSRFAHPTILGDSEYIIQDDKTLTFSPLPTSVGVSSNYRSALRFFSEFIFLINSLFGLGRDGDLIKMKNDFSDFLVKLSPEETGSPKSPGRAAPLREVKIHFRI